MKKRVLAEIRNVVGSKRGYGYDDFPAPFAAALSSTIRRFEILSDGKFGKQRDMNILTQLQNSITDHFKPVYSQLEKEAKKNTESVTNWQVVSYCPGHSPGRISDASDLAPRLGSSGNQNCGFQGVCVPAVTPFVV